MNKVYPVNPKPIVVLSFVSPKVSRMGWNLRFLLGAGDRCSVSETAVGDMALRLRLRDLEY
jgi:hypothetical protein